jgi:hypothetical protein
VQRRAYKLKEWDGATDFLEQVARAAGASPPIHLFVCSFF